MTDVHVVGKTVLVRVDFNVSLCSDNSIANDTRIREAIPTIQYLLDHQAKVVLFSHLGRPKGKVVKAFSLECVAKRLSKLMGIDVAFVPDFLKPSGRKRIAALPLKSVALCENIRFFPGEERNDPAFAKSLSILGDIFVHDAFGTAHRAHASTAGITNYLPSYAGMLLSREVTTISQAVTNPKRPLVVIIGGGKTPEKIRVIEKLLEIADTIYLGGAIANTFFATWGIGVGTSKVDYEMIEMARNVLWKATRVHARLLLPADVVISNTDRTTKPVAVPYNNVPIGMGIFDIGPLAQKEIADIVKHASTVIWNGPMGLYEDARFTHGTQTTCEAIAKSKALSIIGGGDTISTIVNKEIMSHIDLISTGGSAMLEFIEKGSLPSIDALKNGNRAS